MNSIGIIGRGYVGTAIQTAFEKNFQIETFDIIKKLSSTDSLNELVNNVKLIFICLPTPMNKDGTCNVSIVESVIKQISEISTDNKIIAIKSTILPGTTNKLNKLYQNLDILFNPEFLTELNAIDDFNNQNRIIIGGSIKPSTILSQIYSVVFPNVPVIKTESKIAEMVKYFTNTYLATKVAFANDMKLLCEKLEIDYDKVVQYAIYDERLGYSHWKVPGPDGKFGFGGSCFPKDINAIISLSKELGLNPNILNAARKTNLEVRPEKDWENLKGRAVNTKDYDE